MPKTANASFTFICGDDDFLVSRRGRRLYDEASAALDDPMACEVIEGAASKVDEVEKCVDQLQASVQNLSLFGSEKVVWLRDVTFLADSVTGRAEGTKAQVERLQGLLEGLGEGVRVIITACPVDRRRKEFKWFARHGGAEDLKGSDPLEAIAPEVDALCAELGVRYAPGALEELLGRIGGNTRLVIEETGKLAAYLGAEGGTIDAGLVTELVPNFGEGDFFEAADAFFSADLEWTLAALRRHFFITQEARGLITSMQNRNRILIQLRALIDAGDLSVGPRGLGKGALEAAWQRWERAFEGERTKSSHNAFSQNAWYLGNRLAPAAKHFSLRQLLTIQDELLEAFRLIHERTDDHEGVMREMACRCLG